MNLSKLKRDSYVVRLRNGRNYIVTPKKLLGKQGYLRLNDYNEDMTYKDGSDTECKFDIMEVFLGVFHDGIDTALVTKGTSLWVRKEKVVNRLGKFELRSELFAALEKAIDNGTEILYSEECIHEMSADKVKYHSFPVLFSNANKLWENNTNGSFYEVVTKGE